MGKQMQQQYDPSEYATEAWFKSLSWQHQWIEKMAGWWVGEFGLPRTVNDFGAGDGWWPKAFHDMGSVVGAVELHEIAREFIPPQVQFWQHDLRYPVQFDMRYDLVICLEVAEHLPPDAAEVLCETITRHTGDLLLFSAAQPNQQGVGHIHLQPHKYWIERLERGGVLFSEHRTQKARHAFGNIVNSTFEFLPRNVLVFARVK
jgi:hypothetical protein